MGKALVLVKEDRLIGVYSNKKHIWNKIVEKEMSENNLVLKLTEETTTDFNYHKLVKYLKERGMLKLYDKTKLAEHFKDEDPVRCLYRIWECNINEEIELPNYYDDDDDDDDDDEDYNEIIDKGLDETAEEYKHSPLG